MAPAPLFLKYRTKENYYLYDSATGRIIRTDPVIHAVIDDLDVLTQEELLLKHAELGEEPVTTAIGEIRDLQKQGYLRGHRPTELSRVDRVRCDGQAYEIGQFWRETAAMLILGITERCNLQCQYCCYSGNFEGLRTHSSKTMTREIAEKAISRYLESEQASEKALIVFYGGEPLLEPRLLKECVFFAEKRAAELGRTVRFSLTTNGTLLDDEMVDFLVEHTFLVVVSIDGPKEMNDRYRVFPDGKGSFDTVVGNLRRFARRHANFRSRGLNMTLAPPLDLEATDRLLEELFSEYPATRASLVNTGAEARFSWDADYPTRYGCSSKSDCRKNPPREAFRQFGDEDRKRLRELRQAWLESMKRSGAVKTEEEMPLATLLFEGQICFYHRRNVTDAPPEWSIYVPCIPGFTRRFCDADGNYRVCERVDNSDAYLLGNVWDGLDAAKMKRTMELRRHFGDCGNCPSLKVCDVCYARMAQSDAAQAGYDPSFDRQCQTTRQASVELLRDYTEIMESNPDAFDRPNAGFDRSQKIIRFYGPSEPVGEPSSTPLR